MKIKNKLSSQGFSLIEVMVASSLIGIVGYLAIGSGNFLDTIRMRSESSAFVHDYLEQIVEEVRANRHLYKIQFDDKDFTQASSEVGIASLPFSMDRHGYFPKEQCPECPGRLGYILRPYPGYRGLYELIIRVFHPTMFGKKTYYDYQYIIDGK